LKGISFTVKSHTKVAIVGDSGAGKSTIFGLIAKFYGINSGKILIDGQDIAICDPKSIRQFLGSVSQDRDLFVGSILENVYYGKADPENGHCQDMIDEILSSFKDNYKSLSPNASMVVSDIMDAIKQANAQDFVKIKSDLGFVLGEGGDGLSGGQKQRVTIARALYKNPPILLLDEVTSALDQISEAVVQTALDKVAEKRTVLVVAHRLNTIRNSDMILVMDKGEIIASGTHAELIQTSKKYVKMVTAAEEKEENIHSPRVLKLLSTLKSIYLDIHPESEFESLIKLKKLLQPLTKMELPAYKEVQKLEFKSSGSSRVFGKKKDVPPFLTPQSIENIELTNFVEDEEEEEALLLSTRRDSRHNSVYVNIDSESDSNTENSESEHMLM